MANPIDWRLLVLVIAAAAALAAALALQFFGGLAPCPFCVYQRYPYLVVLVVGALVSFLVLQATARAAETLRSRAEVEALQEASARERQVMDILYRRGEATVAEVMTDLPDPPTYSAVLSGPLLTCQPTILSAPGDPV